MGNRIISYNLRGFEVFLWVPVTIIRLLLLLVIIIIRLLLLLVTIVIRLLLLLVTIIIRFGENNVLWTIYIDIHQFRGWAGEFMVHLTYIGLLFIQMKKLQEHDLY